MHDSTSQGFSNWREQDHPTLRTFLWYRCNQRLYSSVFVSAHGLGVFMTLSDLRCDSHFMSHLAQLQGASWQECKLPPVSRGERWWGWLPSRRQDLRQDILEFLSEHRTGQWKRGGGKENRRALGNAKHWPALGCLTAVLAEESPTVWSIRLGHPASRLAPWGSLGVCSIWPATGANRLCPSLFPLREVSALFCADFRA